MGQIILTTFTDSMMGLSYECEPVYEQLAVHYQGQIVFKYVMSGLVRDVSDFMLPEEISLPPEEGIVLYSGNQLVVFYGSNAWAYTRLGHITDKTPEGMRALLSNGDVTITLSME